MHLVNPELVGGDGVVEPVVVGGDEVAPVVPAAHSLVGPDCDPAPHLPLLLPLPTVEHQDLPLLAPPETRPQLPCHHQQQPARAELDPRTVRPPELPDKESLESYFVCGFQTMGLQDRRHNILSFYVYISHSPPTCAGPPPARASRPARGAAWRPRRRRPSGHLPGRRPPG